MDSILTQGTIIKGAFSPNEKELRRILRLPITKQLVYYSNSRIEESKINIVSVEVKEVHRSETVKPAWYTLKITTTDGTVTNINSLYLAEMQKPSFINDMKNAEME